MELVADEIIRFARAQIDAGADIIAISDPSGTGEILGPKLFEEYAVHYINRIIDHLQAEKDGCDRTYLRADEKCVCAGGNDPFGCAEF